jgi:hypothetical protein
MQSHSQDIYRSYASSKSLPLFMQPQWLDAVCGDQDWYASVALDASGDITGLLPWVRTWRYGFSVIQPPLLTQYLGVHFHYPKQKHFKLTSVYAFEKKVIGDLAAQLPRVAMTKIVMPPTMRNNLSWQWLGYKESVQYTYRIPTGPDIASLRSAYKNTVRTNMIKAQEHVVIRESEDPDLLFDLLNSVFRRKLLPNPYTRSYIRNMFFRLRQMQAGTLLVAYDIATDAPHSALLLASDATEMHGVLTGQDAQYKNSCSLFLLYDRMIELAQKEGKILDMNGSMQPSIEHFFRSFGGECTPYAVLRKIL